MDPVGGVYEPRVQGFELVDRVYEPMPCEEAPEGMVAVWSPLLQLELRFADGQLRFWDREKALYVELPEEKSDRLRLKERRGRLEEQRGRLSRAGTAIVEGSVGDQSPRAASKHALVVFESKSCGNGIAGAGLPCQLIRCVRWWARYRPISLRRSCAVARWRCDQQLRKAAVVVRAALGEGMCNGPLTV